MSRVRSIRLGTARRQKGVVLILALLFALAILILGGSAVRTVVQAEKMGGNLRNQSMSFEAAEAAVLAAEGHLNVTPALSHGAVGTGGTGTGDYEAGNIPTGTSTDPGTTAAWSSFTWNSTNATAVTVTVNGVSRTAYYVIEALPAPTSGHSVTEAYRVTAYAQGGSSEAATLLQTTYTR
jgi:type IV pilus assembly protein PilX